MQVITFKTLFLNYIKRHPVTFSLLVANFAMFLWVSIDGGFSVTSLVSHGALVPILVNQGDYWRLFTAMFLHAGFLHFFLNSFFLYYIGGLIERILGSVKYTLLYFISGIGSSIAVWLLSTPNVATIGASGALYGVMAGLFLITYVRPNWFHPRTIRSIRFMVAINIFFTITSAISDGSISLYGHLGGFVIGLAAAYFLIPKEPHKMRRYTYQQQTRPDSHHGSTVIDAASVTDDDIYDSHYTN